MAFQKYGPKKQSDLVSIGGLWVNEKSGNLGGTFRPEDIQKMVDIAESAGAVRLTVLENQWKNGPKAAEYKILAAPAEPWVPGGAKKTFGAKPTPKKGFAKKAAIPDEDGEETDTEEVE